MSWLCIRCNERMESLYVPDFDSDGVCIRCKSNFYIVPAPDIKLEKKVTSARKHNPFNVEEWRKKREALKEAELKALQEYHRTGDEQAYFNRLKQLKDGERNERDNTAGTEPG